MPVLFASRAGNVGIYADIARENVKFGRMDQQLRYTKNDDGTKEADNERWPLRPLI
jgi:hypothetical protein